MSFTRQQLERLAPLWERMLAHPFLRRTRDGELPEETFHTWLRQDYLFVKAALPFVGALLARAPERHREPLGEALPALLEELRLFEERAGALGVSLEGVEPGLTNHAYVQFLTATAHRESYPVAFAAYYGAERAYHESWGVVAEGLEDGSPYWPLVENWAGEEFGEFVAFLGRELDALAAAAGEDERGRMAACLERTVLYEIAFWEMALEGPRWPGLAEHLDPARPGAGAGR